jgi:hypothetical protein
MLPGVFVVVYALVKLTRIGAGNSNSDFSIPWFGKEIKLKGPAWLLVMAIGALMVASPVIAAYAQKPSDVTVPPAAVQGVQNVESLPTENTSAFRFVNDLSVLDLRQSQAVTWYSAIRRFFNKNERNRQKPAILRNVMNVVKIAPTSQLVLTYSTSGKLAVRCLSHNASYQRYEGVSNGKATDTWAVTIDVSTMPIGTPFEVIIEATYYDAFSTQETSNYSTYANSQTDAENLSVVLIFPEDKPMKSVHVMEYPPMRHGEAFEGIGREFRESSNLTYYWSTVNTRPDYYYTLFWTW